MKKVIYLAVACLLIQSCETADKAEEQDEKNLVTTIDEKKEVQSLLKVSRDWAHAASPEEFFSFIGEDAIMMAPDKSFIRGKAGIGKALKEFQSAPGFQITWEPQEAYVSKSGDMGYTVDKILVNYDDADGNKVDLYEKGIAIWNKKEDGSWELAVDIWNTDPSLKSIF